MKKTNEITELVNLTQLRLFHKKSLAEVSGWIGISRSYLFYLEKGQRRLSLENAQKMSEYYHVDLGTIERMYSNQRGT